MDNCQALIERDLRDLHDNLGGRNDMSNLTALQQHTVQDLKKKWRTSIWTSNIQWRTNKKFDKDGTVVVLNKDDYRSPICIMLEKSTYVRLTSNPKRTFQVSLWGLIQEGVNLGVVSQNQAVYIFIEKPVTPLLHGLPKVHKGVIPPPMRPIVSGIGSLNERLCERLDNLLQPLVKRTPGYIQDSWDILVMFENKIWERDFTWVSYAVESLYTNFPTKLLLWL